MLLPLLIFLEEIKTLEEIDGLLYEAADWITDGFQRGSYFNSAKNGAVTWDMATMAQSRKQG